jgi:bifunctional UDP-N-acetylglucosamine pyrophosphorylase/glucosamine-1-phosphate N-acetyltransferase
MNVVILAAGMGKRMQSALPKVLHPLAGKPLLQHVIDTARSLKPSKLCVIYGHGGAAVPSAVTNGERRRHQHRHRPAAAAAGHRPRRDAGPAAARRNAPTLVLYGDVPLTTADSLQRLVEAAGADKLAILTVEQANPFGLGRIVRENGEHRAHRRRKGCERGGARDQGNQQRHHGAPTRHLNGWLSALKNNNAQGEYYLTDIVAQAVPTACRWYRPARRPSGKSPA